MLRPRVEVKDHKCKKVNRKIPSGHGQELLYLCLFAAGIGELARCNQYPCQKITGNPLVFLAFFRGKRETTPPGIY